MPDNLVHAAHLRAVFGIGREFFFFAELNEEFHFTLDACALPETAKCAAYFTPEDDGLTASSRRSPTRHVQRMKRSPARWASSTAEIISSRGSPISGYRSTHKVPLIALYGNNCRKVFADGYIDDRNVRDLLGVEI